MAKAPQYEFEWDPRKARANLVKHGVSFEEAAGIFLDPHASSLFDKIRSAREERWVTLGASRNGTLLVTVHTFQELGQDR
ncbi:MAG TPA: BrnT family toxin [Thermoanaerobaculia bacterium]|nr:BrnT family toxin [Thermoanaerobaculia bacterium]